MSQDLSSSARRSLAQARASLDHGTLLKQLAGDDFLLIQDLDGVCMGLVRDPLTRELDPTYVAAAERLDGHFNVLTNGEHDGRRGVNRLVETAVGSPAQARTRRAYLPGLAAGGVQWQDRDGVVSHPGLSADELAFLATVPARMADALTAILTSPPFTLAASDTAALVKRAVLDNRVSPTLNLNPIHDVLGHDVERLQALQSRVAACCETLLADATAGGLADAFFVHYAPNLGHREDGHERLMPADGVRIGTHDFQFMPRGAVKEAGVLALLNRHVHTRTGRWPLGADFNVRQAPVGLAAQLVLARTAFRRDELPRLVGVGDTVSATSTPEGWRRGGSDRGFLTLVQMLGQALDRDNVVIYVDSSGGEVQRPAVDAGALAARHDDTSPLPSAALAGISDAEDPLRINYVFAGGHREYIDFFRILSDTVK